MENKHSSDGIAEDMIRAFTQVGCAETHAKTLLEKFQAQLNDGIIDISNQEVVEKHIQKINETIEEISDLAETRRAIMLRLFEMYDGDKDYWCEVKHLSIASMTAFEAYQASDDDSTMLNLALETNKRFIRALTHFLGVEISDCAACFSEIIKAKERNDAH